MKKTLFILLLGFAVTTNAQIYYNSMSEIKREVNKGNAQGMYDMGCCYYNGSFGVEQDFKVAVEWFRKAADKGNSNAMYMLGCCYIDEEGVELDYIEGLKYLRLANQKGHRKAQRVIDNIIGKGHEDWGEVELYGYHNEGILSEDKVENLKTEAQKGDAFANLKLGYYYKNVKDSCRAFQFFMSASLYITEKDLEHGELLPMEICDQIGWCYEYGFGVKQDYQKAIEYYEKSDLNSDVEPKSRMDSLCLNLRDPDALGNDIYADIAYLHQNLCYLRLGKWSRKYSYVDDEDNKKDNNKRLWMHPARVLWSAERFYRGMEMKKNLKLAKVLFEKVCDDEVTFMYDLPAYRIAPQTYADACYRLYEFYKNGIGCEKDIAMANAYYNMALKFGSTSAIYDDQMKYETKTTNQK